MTGKKPNIHRTISENLSDRDLKYNSTLQSIEKLEESLMLLYQERGNIGSAVDLGCGHGGFLSQLSVLLNTTDEFGIEIDENKRKIAAARGISTIDQKVGKEALPFESETIDLVISFGLFEHLTDYDSLLKDVHRVLRSDGWFWITVPNLSGWTNRLALLFGYQPRNVEISSQKSFGILPFYNYKKPLGHIRAPTYRALIELLEYHGFSIKIVTSLSPYQDTLSVKLLDAVFARSPRFARRISVLCQK